MASVDDQGVHWWLTSGNYRLLTHEQRVRVRVLLSEIRETVGCDRIFVSIRRIDVGECLMCLHEDALTYAEGWSALSDVKHVKPCDHS